VINPVDVTVTVQATETDTTELENPKITISRTDGAADKMGDLATYSEFSWDKATHKLTGKKSNGTFVNLDKLSLFPGDYTWSVVPTETDKYLPCENQTFTVEKDTPLALTMYALSVDTKALDYTLTVKNEAGAAVADATVTITGVEGISTGSTYSPAAVTADESGVHTAKTGQFGKVTFRAYPNGSYDIQITADSFADQSGKVNTKADGTFTMDTVVTNEAGEVVMGTSKTTLTLNVKDGEEVPKNANIKIEWAGEGEPPVKLPMTIRVDETTGDAQVSLPDGEYKYTVNAPGREPVENTLKIETSKEGGNNKVTVDVNGGTSAGGTTLTGTGTGNSNVVITDKIENTVGDPMEDMYYLVEGVWDDKDNPTQMTVTVSINNNPTGALHGTFGFQYDTNVFDVVTEATDVAYNTTDIALMQIFEGKIPNPTVPDTANDETTNFAYHAFVWEAKGDGTNVTPITTGTTIVTYTLKVKDGVDVKQVMSDKSLSARSFLKTSAVAAFNGAGFDTDVVPTLVMQYWQDAPGALHDGKDTAHKLDNSKALDGGFYQVFLTDSEDGQDQRPYDIRMQIIFENLSTNKAIEFHVTDLEGTDLPGATVTLFDKDGNDITYPDGSPVVGITDDYGKVTIILPDPNGEYNYRVDAPGFERYPDSIADDDHPYVNGKPLAEEMENNPDLLDVIEVEMTPNKSANVIIRPADKVTLLGSDKTVVGEAYSFNVEAKPGYELADPLKIGDGISAKYYPIQEDGTLDETAGEDVTLTWDPVANHYKTPVVNKDQTWTLVITVEESENGVTDKATPYQVHVSADAAGGYFTVGDDTEHKNDDTRAANGTESETYHIFTNGPVDKAAEEAAAKGEQYKAYVIKEVLVNGVALELTDPERIHGLDKKLVDITSDQDITVTYEIATVDPKDPDTPGDDVIVDDPDNPPVPVGDAVVTVVVGEHGKVTVDTADQAGPSSKDYKVTVAEGGTGSFTLKVTPDTAVAQPDGSTSATGDYVIDKVYVLSTDTDGNEVQTVVYDKFTSGGNTANGWTAPDTVTVSGLTNAEHRTVVVSFVHKDSTESTQVFVKTLLVEGNGNISASGLLPYTVGDEPEFTITPADSGWSLSKLTVKKPGAAAAQSKKFYAQEKDGAPGVYTYKMEALEAGTTELGYGFKENSYNVRLTVHYGMMTANFTPFSNVKIEVVRTAGGDGSDQRDTLTYTDALTKVTAQYGLDLEAGTWTIKVSKKGYLDFIITDFTINEDGTVTTEVNGDTKETVVVTDAASGKSYIEFGNVKDGDRYLVAPVLGDADYDNLAVSLGDISQVSNAMVAGAGTKSIEHADLDESSQTGTADLSKDMAYVLKSFGKGVTTMTYGQFLGSTSCKVDSSTSGM
jgi:hypothetical protein